MATNPVRAMLTGNSDGKIVGAMLQVADTFDSWGNIHWKDVRPLPVSPDGVVTYDYHYLTPEQVNPIYTPPIVDDAGLDIYRRLPGSAQQEVRDNIWRYLEQVQHDYPPEPRVEGS